MLKRVPHVLKNGHTGSYRTEDVRFSRCGRRLAVAATENRALIYAVDVESRPIQVTQELELYSSRLSMPHGIDFVDDDLIVVANRNADLQFYRLSFVGQRDADWDYEPEYRAHSPWFGPLGARRMLRDREIVCGPGSVRYFGDRLFVCCNYGSTLSAHNCAVSTAGISVSDEAILAGEGLEIVDGVALSLDGQRLAISDHDHHRIVMHRRAGGLRETCSLRDDRLRFPHGLCFDRSGQIVYCADAGSPTLFVFATHDDWAMDICSASFTLAAVDDDIFGETRASVPERFRPLEGGVKGLDMHPNGRVLAGTCQNQMLAFFETVA